MALLSTSVAEDTCAPPDLAVNQPANTWPALVGAGSVPSVAYGMMPVAWSVGLPSMEPPLASKVTVEAPYPLR